MMVNHARCSGDGGGDRGRSVLYSGAVLACLLAHARDTSPDVVSRSAGRMHRDITIDNTNVGVAILCRLSRERVIPLSCLPVYR